MRKRGFTLIELLVVIAIIGILSGIVITGLNGARVSARDTKRVSDIKNLQLALALYYNDNGHYPCRLDDTSVQTLPTHAGCPPLFFGNYITNLPTDPSTGNVYRYAALVPVASTGVLDGTAACSLGIRTYHLGAAVENPTASYMNQDNTVVTAGSGHITINGVPYIRCNSSLQYNFHGDATACTGTAQATPDPCYSVMP